MTVQTPGPVVRTLITSLDLASSFPRWLLPALDSLGTVLRNIAVAGGGSGRSEEMSDWSAAVDCSLVGRLGGQCYVDCVDLTTMIRVMMMMKMKLETMELLWVLMNYYFYLVTENQIIELY